MPTWRDRREKHLTWKNHLMGGLQPTAEREKYLNERAAANEAADKARIAAEEEARRKGLKNRKSNGF